MRRKKFRGRHRYYRRLWRKACDFKIDLSDDAWYDFWHHHVDWRGRGNENKKARLAHLRALFKMFENMLEQAKAYKKPYQTWLSLCGQNSWQDALYFHTPNPNSNNFPDTFPGFVWGTAVPDLLQSFITDKYEIAELDEKGIKWYVVRVKNGI